MNKTLHKKLTIRGADDLTSFIFHSYLRENSRTDSGAAQDQIFLSEGLLYAAKCLLLKRLQLYQPQMVMQHGNIV